MDEHPAQDVYTIQIRRSGKQEAINPNCRGCVDGFVHVNSLGVRQFTQSGKLPGVCKPCNTQFLRICRLQIRHLTHKDTPIHVCSDCQKTFTHAGNYRKHMLLHQPKEEKQEMASSNTDEYVQNDDADGGEAGTSEQINGAENSAVPSTSSIPKPPYTCTMCARTYLKYGSYVSHLARHDCESLYACEVCKKVYVEKQQLIDHMKEHRSVMCKICKLLFKNENDLESHLLNHVTANKEVQEAPPGGVADKAEGETVEVQTTPKVGTVVKEEGVSKKIVHYCSVCQKEFVNLKSLKTHLSMHVGKAGHECKVCKKRFQFLASLEKHAKLHLIKRPHIRGRKCLKKQRVSSQKYSLRKSSRKKA